MGNLLEPLCSVTRTGGYYMEKLWARKVLLDCGVTLKAKKITYTYYIYFIHGNISGDGEGKKTYKL